jgi:hypothetical protein
MSTSFPNLAPFLVAGFLIFAGLFIIVRRRPLFIDSASAGIAFILVFAASLTLADPQFFLTFQVVPMIVVIIVFYYLIWRRKTVFVLGADGDDLQRAITETLTNRNYQFEQTITGIRIKEPSMEMLVAFRGWVGSGQIRLRGNENREAFSDLIRELRNKEMKTNITMPVLYVIFGVLFILVQVIGTR